MEAGIRILNKKNEVDLTFLNLLLANEDMLYTKTRTAHGNMEAPVLFEKHVFLENNYNAIEVMIDEIAEQIRLRGNFALASLKDFPADTQIMDENSDLKNSTQIFESLINSHESMIHIIQKEIDPIANKFKDIDLAGFLKRLMMQHENMARRLKSFSLKNNSNSFTYDRASQIADWQD